MKTDDIAAKSGIAMPDRALELYGLSGYSNTMMDIGALYCCISEGENRRAVADGYTAAGGRIDPHAVDCAFALNVLLGLILHCENWTKEEWFDGKLSDWCRDIFAPLAQGGTVID